MNLVCSVCTLSDQLQATVPPGVDTAYLCMWAPFNENWLCTVAIQELKTVYK